MSDRETVLYRWRNPTPPQVGRALGVSGQHIKDLCRRLGLPMVDVAEPGAGRPSWRIPRETFRALERHFFPEQAA